MAVAAASAVTVHMVTVILVAVAMVQQHWLSPAVTPSILVRHH